MCVGVGLGGCYSGLQDSFGADGGPGGGADGADGADDGADGSNDGDDDDDDDDDDDGPVASCTDPEVGISPLRRLTRFEYDNTVRDLLGDTTRPAEVSFTPDELGGGYEANGIAPVSATMLDQFSAAAEDLSESFVAGTGVADYVACDVADSACANTFVTEFGRRAFRRDLEAVEVTEYVDLYESGKAEFDANTGIRLVVQAMLLSPNFLYHVEELPAGATETDVVKLSGYELASRVSYFIWSTMPDDELLDAAAAGMLDTPDGLEAQVRRMIEDDKAADAIASFHRQWLHVDNLADKVKDTDLYPQWSTALAETMQAETASFADEVIRRGDAKLQTLLTADWTMGDAALAEIYGAAAPTEAWGTIQLPATERAGMLTQTAFLTTNAHAVEGSWVYRGKFVRENLLCEPLPPPPPGVEVNEPNDAGRLENPECSSCHVLMDPIGSGMDDYDALGHFSDLGSTGEVVGLPDGEFEGVPDLAAFLADSPKVHDCVATQWFRFAARRAETPADACAIEEIREGFEQSGQDIRELLVQTVLSEAFRYRKSS